MTADDLVARLDRARQTAPGRWMARCPAHDDRGPSLSIRETDDGVILLHCFGGCTVDQVTSALGITPADLFPERSRHGGPLPRRHRHTLTARELAKVCRRSCAVLLVAAQDLADGHTLTPNDLAALRRAVADLGRILDEANR